MRKLLLTILTCIVMMQSGLKAQNQTGSFRTQYLIQAKVNAASQAKVTAALLCKKYSGDATMEKALYKALYQGRFEIEVTTLKYAHTPELEARLARIIAKTDSITQSYLPVDKSMSQASNNGVQGDQLEGNSKFAAAVRIKNELFLTQVQIDSLVYHTNRLKELLLSNPDLYPKDYEREVLPRILNDKQYTLLLVSLNKASALRNAKNDWKELKLRKLLTGADSARIVNTIMNYNIGKASVKDRYANTVYQLSESMKTLVTPEPQAATLLRASRRYNNPIPDQQKPDFKW